MNNWYAIEIDETEYWDKNFLAKYSIEKVMAHYVFDADWRVHCCEITPSYELWLVQYAPIFKDGMSETQIEEAEDEIRRTVENALVLYQHCSWIEKMIAKNGEHIVRLGQFDSDEYLDMEDEDDKEKAHLEQKDGATEECQSNWKF